MRIQLDQQQMQMISHHFGTNITCTDVVLDQTKRPDEYTTMAIGEEDNATTMAIGEEC